MTLLLQSRLVGITLILIIITQSVLYLDSKSELANKRNLNIKVSEIVEGIFELNLLTNEHFDKHLNRTLQPMYTQLNLIVLEIVSDASILSRKTQSAITLKEAKAEQLFVISMLLISFLIILMIYWLQKSLLNPIKKLRDYALRLIQGDYTAQTCAPGNGEIAGLFRSFDELRLTVSQKVNEASSDWVWELDENLDIVYLSDGYEQFSGYINKDRIGLNVIDLIGARSDHAKWSNAVAQMNAIQSFRNVEVSIDTKSNRIA